MDSRTRFFEAMSENKRYAARMALQQRRLDKEQKMMLSRVWHQKELLMDDYILINVRTPSPARPASSPFGSSVVRPASSSMSSGPGVSRSLTSVSRVPPGDREHAFTRRMNSEGKTKGDDAERGRRSEAGRRGGRLSDVNGNVTSNCAESSDSKNESQMRKGTNGENSSDHTEPGPSHVRQMTLDPKLVLPMTSKRYRACRQATIVPVISVLGNQATLYPNKEAKFGRAITLHPKVKGRMERTSNIIAALRKTSTTHNMPPTSRAISNAFLTSSSSKGEASTSADPSSDLPLSSPSDPAAGSPVSPVMEGRSREDVSDDSAEVTLVPQVIQQLPSSARRHSHYSDSLLANRNWLTALTARGRSSQRSTVRDSRSARAAVASAGRWTGRLPQYV